MSELDDARRVQALLADVLLSPDAAAALEEAKRNATGATRDWLDAADVDGVKLSRLLVARLRFSRLLAGGTARTEFEQDAAGFTALFKRYHESVPMYPRSPSEEAVCFEQWRSQLTS